MRLFSAGGVALLAGCNLLTGAADLGFDGMTAPGTGIGDAQVDGGSPATSDGGGTDARLDGEGGGSTGPACIPGAVFCDDFDGTDGLKKWGSVKIGGGSSSIDGVAAVSAPSSVLLTWPPAPGSNSTVGVTLQVSLGVTPKSVILSFSIRLESIDDEVDRGTAAAQIRLGSSYALLFAIAKGGNTRLEEAIAVDGGGTSSGTGLAQSLSTGGSFHTVRMVVTLDGVPSATVEIDGKPAGAKALSVQAPRGALSIVLGDANVTGATRETRMRFDNVVVLAQ